jgi:hypothetical protein
MFVHCGKDLAVHGSRIAPEGCLRNAKDQIRGKESKLPLDHEAQVDNEGNVREWPDHELLRALRDLRGDGFSA